MPAALAAFGVARVPPYGAFYGLTEPPFELTPDPRFLYLAARQREALSNLRYGLTTTKGLTVLIGEAGTGKTTLLRTVVAEIANSPSRYVLVSNPTLQRNEFYELLAREFLLSERAAISKSQFLVELQQNIEVRHAAGGLSGIIVDEAQSMPYELLEEVRLLGNIETTTTKLLNIVLSGQPELADRLNEPPLRQLKQRIALRCELRPLTLDETAAYIWGRFRIAGGAPQGIFTRQTVMAIHEAARGIPRTINVLCENALLGGFAMQIKPIPVEVIEEVCRDFDLAGAGSVSDDAPVNRSESSPQVAMTAAVSEPTPMFSALHPKPKRRFSFF